MTTKLEKLYAQRRELTKRISALEAQEREKLRPTLEKRIGECFRRMNRYSSGEEWPMYIRILSVDENLHYRCVQFQRASDDRISVEYTTHYGNFEHEGYTPISLIDYTLAVAELFGGVAGMLKGESK